MKAKRLVLIVAVAFIYAKAFAGEANLTEACQKIASLITVPGTPVAMEIAQISPGRTVDVGSVPMPFDDILTARIVVPAAGHRPAISKILAALSSTVLEPSKDLGSFGHFRIRFKQKDAVVAELHINTTRHAVLWNKNWYIVDDRVLAIITFEIANIIVEEWPVLGLRAGAHN